MIDLEHCLILGAESIDSNSLNRCIFNIYRKIGEFNSSFINATSENVPQSPFFSGGYTNALTDIPYVKSLNAVSADSINHGLVQRLYRGAVDTNKLYSTDSLVTESTTGNYIYNSDDIRNFAPTVDSLMREESPLLFKSFIDDESSAVSDSNTLDTGYAPVIKYTSYMLSGKTGLSFGTITFNRNTGDTQFNTVSIDIKSDLIGIHGVDRIKFFTIGNGYASGIKTISENLDMVVDVGPCNITYNSDTDIVISNITKNDGGDNIIIDKKTGRILDDDEEYDYSNCTVLSNDNVILNFFIIFELKNNVLAYDDKLWCFNVVNSRKEGTDVYYDSTGYAEGYSKYLFKGFEAADCGMEPSRNTHFVWATDENEIGGCTTIATDAFRNCYNATFESLCWFSPRLRQSDGMFTNCKKATFDSIPSVLDLGRIRNSENMFLNCSNAGFNTIESIILSSASRTRKMFSECTKSGFLLLNNLTLNGDSSYMFYDDSHASFESLTSINGSSTSMKSMFENCSNASFDYLSEIKSNAVNSEVDASRMFYGLENPKFSLLTEIGIDVEKGYNGTEMFYGCINANFNNIVSLGSVKNGTRMFMNLDNLNDNEFAERTKEKSTFSNLHSLGSKLTNGTEMFRNDYFLDMRIDGDSDIVYGTSMFMNTSSVIFNGNLNSLESASDMFAHTNVAVIKGDVNSLENGSEMFFSCGSADVSGTMESMLRMDSICLSAGYVHFREIPSTAINLNASFASISGECYIKEWNPSDESRSCNSTFENSKNIWINGNIIGGNIQYTSYMFYNAGQDGTYIVLNNPNMHGVEDTKNRYFISKEEQGEKVDFGIFHNFDDADSESEGASSIGPHISFIGSVDSTESSLASFATSSDASNSMLCFEQLDENGTTYEIYSTSEPITRSSVGGFVKIYTENMGDAASSAVDVYKLTSSGEKGGYYGTISVERIGSTSKMTFYDKNDNTVMFESELTKPSSYLRQSDAYGEKPQIQTFTNIDINTIGENWTDADYMMYNVSQDSLLSGYDNFISNSLVNTDGMFAMSSKLEYDGTFRNAGHLFGNMSRSNIQSMNNMFLNRYICNGEAFRDDLIYDEDYRVSFCVPLHVIDANRAYQNSTFDTDAPYVYLDIPETLTGAVEMFSGYSGPRIRLDYDNDEWITINDNIKTDGMFSNCSFWNNGSQKYRLSTPNIYLQMFNNSDFNMNCVTEFEFRNGKTIAYPYEPDDFFYNDSKIMGCSSVTFSSLENDLTEWFNASATTTRSSVNVEASYLATLVGPCNVFTVGTDGTKNYTKNYEMMTADIIKTISKNDTDEYDGKVDYEYEYDIRFANVSSFTTEMMEDIIKSTNSVYMDSVTAFDNDDNRLTCMFCPSALFKFSNDELGDRLWEIEKNDLYAVIDNIYGGDADSQRYGKWVHDSIFASDGNQLSYSNVTLGGIQKINAKEVSFAFAGLGKAEFSNLTHIGDSIINGYGAFMECSNAKFDSLTSISIMQNDSEDTFSSRFASSDEERAAWYGNYNNMFYGDGNATFENLERITFNSVNGKDSDGIETMMWFDENEFVCYSYGIKDDKTETVSRLIYRIEIHTYKKTDGNTYYKIELHDISGDSIGNKGSSIEYYTDVEYFSSAEFHYEMSDIDGTRSVVVTILDSYNRNNYFVVNNKSITVSSEHPEVGYAEHEDEDLVITPFVSSVNDETYYMEDKFTSLDGYDYILKSDPDVDSDYYTMSLVDTINGTVMRLGTAYSKDVDIKNMYFSRLLYESNDVKFISVTVFKSEKIPTKPISYPDDSVCYRVYTLDGNHYIEQMGTIPGTVEYASLLSLENVNDEKLSHKAFCSGMFKGCANATFDSIDTICIPMNGSCAEMFSGCTSIDFTGGTKFKMLFLPVSWQYDGYQESDHENYKKIFNGVSTSRVNLESLTTDNTNIYKLGKQQSTDASRSGHHLIGEQLFDGMTTVSGGTTVTFDVSGGNPFRYQNAIYDLHMDATLAKLMFDHGDTHNVVFYDAYGNVALDTDVEYRVWDSLWIPSETVPDLNKRETNYNVRIPSIDTTGLELWKWNAIDRQTGTEYLVPSSDTYFGPITSDFDIYPLFHNRGNESIVVYSTDSDEPSGLAANIIDENNDDNMYQIETSFNSTPSNEN